MSVDTFVFIRNDKLPTTTDWNAALKSAGIPLVLDDIDDLPSFSGYLPAKFATHDAGFEWMFGRAQEIAESVAASVGDRTHVGVFTTHGEMIELVSSLYAAAALTKITDGLAYDGESGEFFSPDDLMSIAKDALEQI